MAWATAHNEFTPQGVRDPGVRDPGVRDPGVRDPGVRDPKRSSAGRFYIKEDA